MNQAAQREQYEPREGAPALEIAANYCPACFHLLEPRNCKLICPVCDYYMSCSDYY